jgi:WhiB family redox-sensing transcriptional regulator
MSAEWMDRAKCRGRDPERWFPVGDGDARRVHSAYAMAVCGQCPVRVQCARRAHDMKRPRPVGIWAGVDLGDSASQAVHRDALDALDEIADGVSA